MTAVATEPLVDEAHAVDIEQHQREGDVVAPGAFEFLADPPIERVERRRSRSADRRARPSPGGAKSRRAGHRFRAVATSLPPPVRRTPPRSASAATRRDGCAARPCRSAARAATAEWRPPFRVRWPASSRSCPACGDEERRHARVADEDRLAGGERRHGIRPLLEIDVDVAHLGRVGGGHQPTGAACVANGAGS